MSEREQLIGKLSDSMDPDNARKFVDRVIQESHTDIRCEAWVRFAAAALSRIEVTPVDAAAYANKMLEEFDKKWTPR